MMQGTEAKLRVSAEALEKLRAMSRDPASAGKAVRIRPVGIT
jgi:hypothetical protein